MSASLLLGAVGCGRRDAVGPARNVVVVVADGGWDPTFALDPKLGVRGIHGPAADASTGPRDRETTGRWGPLEIAVNPERRPAVAQLFDRWSKRLAVVRGVWVGSLSHWMGRSRILTGQDDRRATDWITQVGAALMGDRPLGIVDLSGHARFGDLSAVSLRAGRRGQLGQLLIPERRLPLGDGSPRPTLPRRDDDDVAIDAWLADRAKVDPRRGFGRAWARSLDARIQARGQAEALLAEVPAWSATLSGDSGLSGQVDLAVALLDNQICRAVLLDSGHSWDTHADHGRQHGWYQSLFAALGQLLSGLYDSGLLDETLVVVVSEMGRTGARNSEDGTEHWPYTSVLLAGADIDGPGLIGATDEALVGRPVDLVRGTLASSGGALRYDHLVAGIVAAVGVDPAWVVPNAAPLLAISRGL